MEIGCQSDIIISIHGSAEKTALVQLGGLDEELKRHILEELQATRFDALDCGHLPFGATDHKNVCNLCGRGMGLQMEISRGLRATMFQNLSHEGRRFRTAVFDRFINAVRRGIAPFAIVYTEDQPLLNTD